MSFARGVPNPIAIVIKYVGYASGRLCFIANPIAVVIVHPVVCVVVVLTIVVVIRGVVVVIRTIVIVVLAVVVIERGVFPARDLSKAAARDCKARHKHYSPFHYLPAFH